MLYPEEPGSDLVPARLPGRRTAERSPPTSSSAAGTLTLADLPSAGEFTKLALWMAGSLAGVSTPAHAALGRHCRSLARRLGWPTRRAKSHRPDRADAMTLFADAVVGTSRDAVGAVFGEPRLATAPDGTAAARDAVRRARTWYYPTAGPAPSLVAIEFADDHACRVVFVRTGER